MTNVTPKMRSNVFRGAWIALEEMPGSMHRSRSGTPDIDAPHSSQALALDVFGTLKGARSRDRICDHLALMFNVPAGGPWSVDLEYTDPAYTLGEKRHQSQMDVLISGRKSIIALECKFAERRMDPCGQLGRTERGHRQCNGNYEMQTNPANRRHAFCALTSKGVRYWDFIPRVLRYSAEKSHRPCPVASNWYQWMRTMVTSLALADERHLKSAAGLVFVDRQAMPLHSLVREEVPRMQRILTGAVGFELLSYEKLPAMFGAVCESGERSLFRDLQSWVEAKVNWVEVRLANEHTAMSSRSLAHGRRTSHAT